MYVKALELNACTETCVRKRRSAKPACAQMATPCTKYEGGEGGGHRQIQVTQPLWIKIVNHVVARCGVSTAAVNRNIVQNQRYHISRVNCRPAASDAA